MSHSAVWKHALALCAAAARAEVMMGFAYGPVPLKSTQGVLQLPQDDWMCGEAVPMWGRAGRGDLRHMRALGANVVRLYGNNPDNDHTTFLDEARAEGLGVLPGMSDHPFYRQTSGSCQQTDYDCFKQIKLAYLKNLIKGFLLMDRRYHPALRAVDILNEPDLKMPQDAATDAAGPYRMVRTIISAFDAMLEAEKEAGVVGPLINFTATFSYAICSACDWFKTSPSLGQIAQLQDGMLHPQKYNYTPRNNITAAFQTRWVHSFNTHNPATDLQSQFLDGYNRAFPNTPVYIGEYHMVGANQTQDIGTVLDVVDRNPLLRGIAFFEYQVAYWKAGFERAYGMMGLGSYKIAQMSYFSTVYDVWCLQPVQDAATGGLMADAVARAFGGTPVDTSKLCVQNPFGAALRESGFAAVASQNSTSQMALYVERVLRHMGATVADGPGLNSFAAGFAGAAGNAFPTMMSQLGAHPTWAAFDPDARCLANRYADPGAVGKAINWACQHAVPLVCSSIPTPCQRSPYLVADYVFSRYFEGLGSNADPLAQCDFGGAGIFASSRVYSGWTGAPECGAGDAPSTSTALQEVTTAPPEPTGATSPSAAASLPEITTAAPAEPTLLPPTPSTSPSAPRGTAAGATSTAAATMGAAATTSGPASAASSAGSPCATPTPAATPTAMPLPAPAPAPFLAPQPTEFRSFAAGLRPGPLLLCDFALPVALWALLRP